MDATEQGLQCLEGVGLFIQDKLAFLIVQLEQLYTYIVQNFFRRLSVSSQRISCPVYQLPNALYQSLNLQIFYVTFRSETDESLSQRCQLPKRLQTYV